MIGPILNWVSLHMVNHFVYFSSPYFHRTSRFKITILSKISWAKTNDHTNFIPNINCSGFFFSYSYNITCTHFETTMLAVWWLVICEHLILSWTQGCVYIFSPLHNGCQRVKKEQIMCILYLYSVSITLLSFPCWKICVL